MVDKWKANRMKNPIIDESGNKYWYNDYYYKYWHFTKKELHREDGPAIEWADGKNWWYKNGLLHREDGPAQELDNGDKYWWFEGNRVAAPLVDKITTTVETTMINEIGAKEKITPIGKIKLVFDKEIT